MKTANWLNWLVAVAGLWELLSPFALGYSALTVAMWNAVIVGVVLIALGAWAALYKEAKTDRTLDWINAVLGVWLVISPFALDYSATAMAMWNNIIVGIVVLALAGWAAFAVSKEVSPQT
ncbi:MAG: SPW repeat protein [Anaerolineales bacterium]|nr:SPW repeat protein [Anaerolineales bacterium]